MLNRIIVAALAVASICAGAALAQTSDLTSAPIVVVVDVPVPNGVPRERILAGMQSSVPQYENMPGLIRKYFTLSDAGEFGGVYLWRSRAEAETWFNAAWSQRVSATYGAVPKVTYYAAPIIIEGGAAPSVQR